MVRFDEDFLVVELLDGRTLSVPLEWFPRLRDAPRALLTDYRLLPEGIGIHWEALDEDISIRGLLGAARQAA